MSRQHLFTVKIDDCIVQTFRAGGKGGANQNARDTGVRVIHPPSGARGESRESRKQLDNKRIAFRRMAETNQFQSWARMRASGLEAATDAVERQMAPENLKIEVKKGGQWELAE